MIPIKGLEKSSLIDYPGKVSAVVFLGGCNFLCPFCHNRELVIGQDRLPIIPEKEVLDLLTERKKWLDGVVITGGEPGIHRELPEFLKKIKGLGYPVKLDTNGTNPDMLKELIGNGQLDYVAMDVKGPLAKYDSICGMPVDTRNISESIRLIISSGIAHEFRSTVLPALHSREDVEEMARMVNGGRKFWLQQFRPRNTLDPEFMKERPFTREEMLELRELCRRYVDTDVRLA
jgi:pyruvate formate lyase activating enzyme